jgi:group I intron endonuclease
MTTNRYEHSKVYKLVNDNDDEIYVGSTTDALHKRMYSHKRDAKAKPNMRVYHHLNKVGFENVRIVLIELFSCNSREELIRRERHWFDILKPSLNTTLPSRTTQQYRLDNRETLRKQNKEWEKNNREYVSQKKREWREKNREAYNASTRARRARKTAESSTQTP